MPIFPSGAIEGGTFASSSTGSRRCELKTRWTKMSTLLVHPGRTSPHVERVSRPVPRRARFSSGPFLVGPVSRPLRSSPNGLTIRGNRGSRSSPCKAARCMAEPPGQCERRSRKDFPLDPGAFVGDRFAQIVFGLKTDQKTGGNAKIALETQGGLGRDAFSSVENIAETAARDRHVPGCPGCWNFASFQFIVDQTGGGVGAEFHRISGCLRS